MAMAEPDGTGESDIDVSNDPTIEALGSEECTKYAQRHWQQLTSCRDATELVMSESSEEDDKLHKVYQANFGGAFGLDLFNTTHAALHSGGTLETWRSVLTAMEGRSFAGQPMNMMTLLRADALSSYDPAETDLILVPRAQFLMIELARNRAGVYAGLKQARQRREVVAEASALVAAASQRDSSRMLATLHKLACHRSIPRTVLQETGVGKLLARLAKLDGSFKVVAAAAAAVHRQWRAAAQLQSVTDAQERLQMEEWLQANIQLQRLLHSRQATSPALAAGSATAAGGLELYLFMTVQTPLLAAKIREWQDLQGVHCQGLCAAVRFPREAEIVLQGAVSTLLQSHCLPSRLFVASRVNVLTLSGAHC
jgi:hypothetical protein